MFLFFSVVIDGEASESDDDDEDDDGANDNEVVIKSTRQPGDPVTESSRSKRLADGRDSSTPEKKPAMPRKTEYESPLHFKLAETNASLNNSFVTQWQKMIKSTMNDLQAVDQIARKTRQTTQETSQLTRDLTNKLFQIEDAVDVIASCSLLPDIKF